MKRFFVLALSLSLLSFSPAFASDTARSLGMASAVVAIDDLSAPIYNPAVLAKMGKRAVGISMGCVRQTLDISSPGDPNIDDLRSDASQIVPLDNVGFVTVFGPGTAYVGFDTQKRFFGHIKDVPFPSSGTVVYADTTMYSPTIGYGMMVNKALSLGAAISYKYMSYSGKMEWDAGSAPLWKIERNLGVNLGALYTLTPQIDLGASLSMLGASSVNGYVDGTDLPGQDYVIRGNHPNPSTMRFGGSYRPRDNINIGMQFDVINGFAISQKEDLTGDGDYWVVDDTVKADTVIATRLGAEYTLSVPNATVPIRAGLCFIPDNRMTAGFDGGFGNLLSPVFDAASYLGINVPNTTIFSLGVGYNSGIVELGLSASWMTGRGKILFADDTITPDTSFVSIEQKIVASATFKI
jgi:hypothetical protein